MDVGLTQTVIFLVATRNPTGLHGAVHRVSFNEDNHFPLSSHFGALQCPVILPF